MDFGVFFVGLQSKSVHKHNVHSESNEDVPIRTVYVAPIKQNMVPKIYSYFERFGEVEKVRIHQKDTFRYGFVQFKTTDAANKVLTRHIHWIAKNSYVKVKAADFWHQPDFSENALNPTFPPPDFDSDSNILNALNDDCLRVIFKHLSLVDLISAADVCVRFNQHAQEAFSSKHSKSVVIDDKTEMFPFRAKGDQRLRTLESMLRNFGPSIRSLTVAPVVTTCRNELVSHQNHFKQLEFIGKHAASHLTELKLMNFNIGRMQSKVAQSAFSNVERLELKKCSMSTLKSSLATAKNLKMLHIEACKWDGRLINQRFDTLQEIQLVRNPNLSDIELCHFITSNRSLSKFVIKGNEDIYSMNMVRLIGQRLKNLVELEIDQEFNIEMHEFQKSFQYLSQLNSLKSLTLNFNEMPIESLMGGLATNNVPIEQLTLKCGEMSNDAIESISKLKLIKTLELKEIEDLMDTQIIELIRNLPHLQNFTLDGASADDLDCDTLKEIVELGKQLSNIALKSMGYILSIDDDDYKSMLKSVQSRRDKVRLCINVSSQEDVIEFDEELLAKNRDWLNIKQTIMYDTIDAIEFILGHGLAGLHDWFQSDDDDDDDDFDMFDDSDESDDDDLSFLNLIYRQDFDLD